MTRFILPVKTVECTGLYAWFYSSLAPKNIPRMSFNSSTFFGIDMQSLFLKAFHKEKLFKLLSN